MTEKGLEERRRKAKELRYKKPIVKGLSMELIDYELSDMQEACGDIQWAYQSELADDLLGEEEAAEFKLAFSSLEYDIERFMEDVHEGYVYEYYDEFLVVLTGKCEKVELLGYDSYEEDYFGIEPGYETNIARKEAEKRLERLKKSEIIEAGQQCFAVAFQYIGLRTRFEELKASIDVLRGEAKGMFETIDSINEAWEKACSGESYRKYKRWGWSPEMNKLDSLIMQIDPNSDLWLY